MAEILTLAFFGAATAAGGLWLVGRIVVGEGR